jgi:peptide/nickel transport system substrate-binding protein
MPEVSDERPAAMTRREFLGRGVRAAAAAGVLSGGLTALLSGCGGGGQGQVRSDLLQGSIRIALDADVQTLDPAMHRSRTVEAVVRNICDGLVTRDAQMRYVPQLATSWNVEGDRWVFTLREGVKFHTGEPPRKDLLGPVLGVEVVNAHTVTITTDGPYPILEKKLVFQEICPKAYFEKVGPEEFAREPVGTGPFRLAEWRPGERVVLERFDDYYGGSPGIAPAGPAKLDGVIFRPLEEAATRLASLEAREVQVVVNGPPDHAARVDATAHARLSVAQGTRTHFVGLNVSRRPFSDRRVREAMRWAVDPEPIIEQFLLGRATALPGMLVPMAFGCDRSLPAPRQDAARARALLKQAGYPEGLKATLDCEGADKRIAEAIAGIMAPGGVQVEVRVWKQDNLLNQLRKQQRDMFLTAWGNSSLDPSGILPVLFRSDGYSNFFGYRNPEVDRLLAEADRAMDPKARAEKYIQVQQLLHQDAPCCFHFAKEELYGISQRVSGFEARPDGMLPMHDVSLA